VILLKLDPADRTPMFRQIVEQVRGLIDRESLRPGQAMPATRRLAEDLGVHRTTVYKAYEELWALGYLESTPGSYTRVRWRPRPEAATERQNRPAPAWGELSSPASRNVHGLFQRYRPESSPGRPADIIDLSRLDMDPRLFPAEQFRRCLNKAMRRWGPELLGYGERQGFRPLREYLAQRLQMHGIAAGPEEILITNGSQNALDLVFRLLVAPGRRVLVESPTYAAMIPLLRLHQAEITGIPMTGEGLDLQALERELRQGEGTFLYTMPNFQNPTGITTGQAHREALLRVCERFSLTIVEDGFEEEMKYCGKVTLPIKSMDCHQQVIYLGTFSKVLFPGVRIGWIVAHRDCIERLLGIKRFCDLTTTPVLQAAMYEFCREGYYDWHIRRMHRTYRKRLQTTLRAMRQHLPRERADWTEPVGGYLLWVRLRDPELTAEAFQERLARCGVVVSPGEYYFPDRSQAIHFRISISMLDEAQIEEGIRRLGRALQDSGGPGGGER